MRQYFVDQILTRNEQITLSEQQSHHIKDVLRMKDNDKIRLVDSQSNVFLSEIKIGSPVTATILEQIDILKNPYKVTLIAALVKKEKWELLVQKATELGVDEIVPLVTERTIIHLEDKEIPKKLERWNKIVLEAAQQSNREDIPKVVQPIKLKQLQANPNSINLVAYENREGIHLYDRLDNKDICAVIGPEGGFSEKEIQYLNGIGFENVSLGKRILRAETAGMYILSCIDSFWR